MFRIYTICDGLVGAVSEADVFSDVAEIFDVLPLVGIVVNTVGAVVKIISAFLEHAKDVTAVISIRNKAINLFMCCVLFRLPYYLESSLSPVA